MGIPVTFESQDLKTVVDFDPSMEHLAVSIQALRNTQAILGTLANLEKTMSEKIDALTAEVANAASVMNAAGGVIEAALSVEATLKDQLAKATDPAEQQALQDATDKLASTRATLQAEIDKANAVNPPATSAASSPTASDAPSDLSSPSAGGEASPQASQPSDPTVATTVTASASSTPSN